MNQTKNYVMTAQEIQAQPRVSQVEEQRQNLQETANDLDKIVSVLEERLGPVAFTGLPKSEEPPPVPTPTIVPLAASLAELRRNLSASIDRLRSLNGAIQL